MASATPSVSKCRRHSGEMNSPQSFARGNFFCSTSSTRRLLRARWIAALDPAGPAPEIITSKSCGDLCISCFFVANGGGAQHQPKWKMALDPDISQPRALGQLEQLITLESTQDRQRTVMSHQSIVQNDLAGDGVEKIRDRMPVQVDHEYPPLGNATHFAKYMDHLLVEKMMREQRADHVIKFGFNKRDRKSTRLNSSH